MDPRVYKEAYLSARTIFKELEPGRHSALAALRTLSNRIDALLNRILNDAQAATPALRDVSLVALGGYGREEQFPFSDVDLLVLHPRRTTPAAVEPLVRLLWDSGMTLGCAVRSPEECGRIMGQDVATDSTFLDMRPVAGASSLYHQLRESVVLPHFRRNARPFVAEMRAALEEGLHSSTNAAFRIEPDLKNGICCLRDCQRLLWAEKARGRIAALNQVPVLSRSGPEHGTRFLDAYELLCAMRMHLHLLAGARLDVLETGLQPAVAGRLGLADAGVLMERFYRAVRDVRTVLLTYIEREISHRSLWHSLRRRVSARPVMSGVLLVDGLLSPGGSVASDIGSPAWVMEVFKLSLTLNAPLSTDLANRVANFARFASADDFRSPAVAAVFRDLLARDGRVAPAVAAMHETGVLGRIVPQFDSLTCKVEYDSYHEYTVDQHVLLMLAGFDDLPADMRETMTAPHAAIRRKLLLRLGILLHDIGKGQPGDHVHNGAVIAEAVCERLGLNEADTDRVVFLIYNHLELHNLSILRELDEASCRAFASRVGDVENLDMLLLLTALDIHCVGSRTWTAWKATLLLKAYEAVRAVLQGEDHAILRTPSGADPLTAYDREVLPEDRELHRAWLAELDGSSADVTVHLDELTGFQRLTVCGHDRVGFLSDLIGCISSEGCNILSAHVYTMPGGKVLDVFNVEPPLQPAITPPERVRNILAKWELIRNASTSADRLIEERLRKYPPGKLRGTGSPVEARIDNRASPSCTLVEIASPDNFGLLHKIVRCMNRCGLNIVSARLSTRIDLAVDVFYVTERDGGKVVDENRIREVTGRLRETLG